MFLAKEADWNTEYAIAEPYNYSDIVDSNLWRNNTNRAERAAALQIPVEVMQKMTTEALFRSVLDYPFLFSMTAANTLREGFISIYNEFSGLAVLALRKDIGSVLVREYGNIVKSSDRRDTIMLEVLLVQPEILINLASHELRMILDIAVNNTIEMESEDVPVMWFINTFFKALSELPESPIWNVIDVEDNIPLREQEKNGGSGTSSVPTPKNTSVTVKLWTSGDKDYTDLGQLGEDTIAYIKTYVKTNHPTAVQKDEPTMKYNCHSYGWDGSHPRHALHWMDDPSAYMSDKSYSKVTGIPPSIAVGDRAYWGSSSNTHTAIIRTIIAGVVVVESKWGGWGLYSHNINDSIYGTNVSSYWR